MIMRRRYPSSVRLDECSLADWRKSRSQVWKEGLKRESKRPLDGGAAVQGGEVSFVWV